MQVYQVEVMLVLLMETMVTDNELYTNKKNKIIEF